MTDINEYKIKKTAKILQQIGKSTKEGGHTIAEALFAFAYRLREEVSQTVANQRNIDKLNPKGEINRCKNIK